MKVWAVSNQKGGVGKTTTSVSLAGILAQQGENTLLVDLDPHGSLSSYFGVDPETVTHSVYDIFQDTANNREIDPAKVIQPTAFENLSLMPASTAMATLEKQLGARGGTGMVLSKVLQQLTERYHYVVIDSPPMLGMLMVSALAACDKLIVPVQTEYLAIKGLQRMLRTINMIQKSLGKELGYDILPTMYDQRTMASRQSLEQLRNDYPEHLVSSVIPVDTKFRDASHQGKPLSHMSSVTHGIVAYKEFLVSLLDEMPETLNQAVATSL